jgi:ketosteroid isomerase-like protein
MKSIKFAIFIVLFVSCLLLIPKHPANANFWFSDRAAILEVNQQFMDAIEDGDGAAVGALYTEDATLFAPNLPPFVGQEAIGSFFQGAIDQGVTQAVLETDELVIFHIRKMAYEVGRYQLWADGFLVDEGPYIVIWKKERGRWGLHRDIFNSSLASE